MAGDTDKFCVQMCPYRYRQMRQIETSIIGIIPNQVCPHVAKLTGQAVGRMLAALTDAEVIDLRKQSKTYDKQAAECAKNINTSSLQADKPENGGPVILKLSTVAQNILEHIDRASHQIPE